MHRKIHDMEGVGIGGKCAMTKEKSGDREMV
jgi:hypothetical protein